MGPNPAAQRSLGAPWCAIASVAAQRARQPQRGFRTIQIRPKDLATAPRQVDHAANRLHGQRAGAASEGETPWQAYVMA
jgi:hypothetical protein